MGLWVIARPIPREERGVPWAWGWSVPLAALNAALSIGAMTLSEESDAGASAVLLNMFLGATLGVIVWGPALGLTLVAFGAPIAWSQQLAKKGLAGEERGERIVGTMCTVLALGALALSFHQVKHVRGNLLHVTLWEGGLAFMRVAGIVGALVGGVSATLAARRESQRRAFVADAEQGKIPGYRVDTTPEGKALVRVSEVGHGYRVANFSEQVVLLDEDGAATESRFADRV